MRTFRSVGVDVAVVDELVIVTEARGKRTIPVKQQEPL